ncbi:MAG: bifunctional UDP-N-acetylglucosamine diphosphorylase/glucosamine-1-phosphate N-acetyltransferase GlmU [Acidobacteria bacterium]|nr:MAG: bifunctional UDP-N-acetylglucosamine diphosphorylase/glucosamine-1-phosphate N-acetyltransferase GlmU [Acidobacteriota bacterium]
MTETTPSRQRHAVVLAAGKSTRFKSEKPKLVHDLCGKPLVCHVVDKLRRLDVGNIIVVLGHESETVRQALSESPVQFAVQAEQLGTGHATMCAAPALAGHEGSVLVVYGDTPLISHETLQSVFECREEQDADEVILTAIAPDPYGYGRVVRDVDQTPLCIVEEKDASPDQKAICEINAGFACFKIETLLENLPLLSSQNAAGEYYLTDLLALLRNSGRKVIAVSAKCFEETAGVNSREELAWAESHLRAEIASRWMKDGVTILNPATVYLDPDVTIGPDTIIYPGVFIEGKTTIGPRCKIYSGCHLLDATLEEDVVVDHCSVIRRSTVGRGTTVGPFAHLREHTSVAAHARIGNFVEVKKSVIGEGSKASHLTYLGDATLGRDVNIGAGTITCNYDGVNKNKTIIEDGVFVGSDSQLIAPVTIHQGAYIAAGSSITEDVPAESLAIARGRQVNKEGWAKGKAKKKG